MRKGLFIKAISILLVVILSSIIPTIAVYADTLKVDAVLSTTQDDNVVNISAKLKVGETLMYPVLIYANGSGNYTPSAIVTGVGNPDLTATQILLSDSKKENGKESIVSITPTSTGTFSKSVTWSSSHPDLKNSVVVTFNYTVEQSIQTPVISEWPIASDITYGQALSESVLRGGNASVPGSFEFVDPLFKPLVGTSSYQVKFIPNDLSKYTQVNGNVSVITQKAKASIIINGYVGIYDGLEHNAYGSAFGVNNEDLSSKLSFTEGFKNVPGGAVKWEFDGGNNYLSEEGDVFVIINKATPSVTWPEASNIVYGQALLNSTLSKGNSNVSGSFDFVDPTIKPNAGMASYSVKFKPDDSLNYNEVSGSLFVITEKAKANVKIDGYSGTYDGLQHGATGSATGVNEEDLTHLIDFGSKFKDAPGGKAEWKFFGNENYIEDSGSVDIVINKAEAAVLINGTEVTYDGESHGATGTATGVNNEDLTDNIDFGETFVNVPGGTAYWFFNGGVNYEDRSGSVKITINKATPVVTWPSASIVFGQELDDAVLIGGTSSVPGKFMFIDSTFKPIPGTLEYDAEFVPEDTTNYETVKGKIKVSTNYVFSGILQPINSDGSSVFKAGSTIPVKFKLSDFDGHAISTAIARISYVKITDGVAGDVTEAISTSAATTGNLFRYDVASEQYIFNLSTKGLKSGTYELRISLDDGTVKTVKFGLK